MRELIESALRSHNADYLEVRLEEAESTILRYRGRELEEVGRSAGMGGCVRAAVKGGWGFVSFNDLSDLQEKVDQAVRQARLVGSDETHLADVQPVVDVVEPSFPADPRLVSLAEKKRVLDEYVELLWSGARHPDLQPRLRRRLSQGLLRQQPRRLHGAHPLRRQLPGRRRGP